MAQVIQGSAMMDEGSASADDVSQDVDTAAQAVKYAASRRHQSTCMKTATKSYWQSKRAKRADAVIAVLAIVLLAVATVSFMLGRYPIEPAQVWSLLLSQVMPVDRIWTGQQADIFFGVRLPRVLMAVLVGCCLAVAGAAYQGIFQNPLVSPDILGASQGAAFGAAVAILTGASSFVISAYAFGFAMLCVGIVMLVAQRAKGNPLLGVVLAGIMVGSLFSAGVSFIKLEADPTSQLPAITYWLMGSLTDAGMRDLAWAIVPMAVGTITLYLLRWRINILTMGDDEARTMGVNTNRIRAIVILAATLVTAASVSVSGMIGWVGLVIPHLSRMLVGCDYRKLLPASMIMGAGFLLIVDNFSRLVSTAEIPIGILTAFVGAPFFLYLIIRQGNRA